MFFSATPSEGSRQTAILNNQGNEAFWHVVRVNNDVSLYFALLNELTGSFGRIISALTQSAVYHVETRIDAATDDLWRAAEARLGRPYDYEGMLGAWKDSGYHTQGKEFCSGFAYELLNLSLLPGLTPYPNPGKLLFQVAGILGEPPPKFAIAPAQVTLADLACLDTLHADGLIACGTVQEIIAVIGV